MLDGHTSERAYPRTVAIEPPRFAKQSQEARHIYSLVFRATPDILPNFRVPSFCPDSAFPAYIACPGAEYTATSNIHTPDPMPAVLLRCLILSLLLLSVESFSAPSFSAPSPSLKPYISKLINRESLTAVDTETIFKRILANDFDPVQVGSVISLLRSKGENSEEVSGMVRAMNEACSKGELREGVYGGDGRR